MGQLFKPHSLIVLLVLKSGCVWPDFFKKQNDLKPEKKQMRIETTHMEHKKTLTVVFIIVFTIISFIIGFS